MLRRRIETFFVILALGVAATIGAARVWPEPGRGFWWRLAAIASMPPALDTIDITQTVRHSTPNDALVCPERVCQKATADILAPIFPVPAGELQRKVGLVALSEPRTEELACPADTDCSKQSAFVQYSALFMWPDVIDVRVLDAGASASTLVIYSRSVFGYTDLGVNRVRVERWLAALHRVTSKF